MVTKKVWNRPHNIKTGDIQENLATIKLIEKCFNTVVFSVLLMEVEFYFTTVYFFFFIVKHQCILYLSDIKILVESRKKTHLI